MKLFCLLTWKEDGQQLKQMNESGCRRMDDVETVEKAFVNTVCIINRYIRLVAMKILWAIVFSVMGLKIQCQISFYTIWILRVENIGQFMWPFRQISYWYYSNQHLHFSHKFQKHSRYFVQYLSFVTFEIWIHITMPKVPSETALLIKFPWRQFRR